MVGQHRFTGLSWVQEEIQLILQRARRNLEDFTTQPLAAREAFQSTAAELREIRGVLYMLELPGAVRLTEEMVNIVQALLDGLLLNPDEAAEALMLALIQLPDYLSHLQHGEQDYPLLLLPLINDLRVHRQAPKLTESHLFTETLAQRQHGKKTLPSDTENLQQRTQSLRPLYLRALLAWFQGDCSALETLRHVFRELAEAAQSGHYRDLFRAAEAVAGAVVNHQLEADKDIKAVIGRIDHIIKHIIAGVTDETAAEMLLNDYLYHVARSSAHDDTAETLRRDFMLDAILPDEAMLERVRQRLTGPGDDAMTGLIDNIQSELVPIKDALDMAIAGGKLEVGGLQTQIPTLYRLASTLEMVNLTAPAHNLRQRAAELSEIVNRDAQQAIPELVEIAGDLLRVEESLGQWRTTDQAGEAGAGRQQALNEALLDMGKVKEAVVAYMGLPDDYRPLTIIPNHLKQVAGILRILEHPQVATLLEQVARYIQQGIMDRLKPPDGDTVDILADAISSLEYYLESAIQDRGDLEQVLTIAGMAVERLPIPQQMQEVPPPLAAPAPAPAVEESAVCAPPEVDPELLAIFMEEAREEIAIIQEIYPLWRAHRQNTDHLTRLRRSFHTLKGSSRLVGLMAIGDFAWCLEDLFNQLIDQRRELNDAIMDLIGQAVDYCPELITAKGPMNAEISAWLEKMPALLAPVPSPPAEEPPLECAPESASLPPTSTTVEQPPSPESDLAAQGSESRDITPDLFEDAHEFLHMLPGLLEAPQPEAQPADFFSFAAESTLLEEEPDLLEQRAETPETPESPRHSEHLFNLVTEDTLAEHLSSMQAGPQPEAQPADFFSFAVEPTLLEEEPDLLERLSETPEIPESPQHSGHPLNLADDMPAQLEDFSIRPDMAPGIEPQPAPQPSLTDLHNLDAAACPMFEEEPSLLEMASGLLEALEPAVDVEAAVPAWDATPGDEPAPRIRDTVQADVEPCPQADTPDVLACEPEEDTTPALPADMDPELYEVFMEEAREELAIIGDSFHRWRAQSHDLEALTRLRRSFHTLKGSGRLVGLHSVGDYAWAGENLLNRVLDGTLPSNARVLDIMTGLTQAFHRLLAQPEKLDAEQQALVERALTLAAGTPETLARPAAGDDTEEAPPSQNELPASAPQATPQGSTSGKPDGAAMPAANAQSQDKPSPETGPAAWFELRDSDHELVDIFLQEAEDLIEALDSTLKSWHGQQENLESVSDLQRTLHTLKGGARLSGITPIADLSHAFESLLIAVAEQRLEASDDLIDFCQGVADRLNEQLARVRNGQPVPVEGTLARRLVDIAEGHGFVRAQVRKFTLPPPAAGAPAPPPLVEPLPASPAPHATPASEEAKGPEESRKREEQIRVRSDLLDRLVNNAGEVSIYRARLEQQNTELGFNLGELLQTVSRLSEQLRNLDIETEAQILSRFERVQETRADARHPEFDPLELDRFSTVQQLSRALLETVNDLRNIADILGDRQRETETLLVQQERLSNDLQDGLLRTRMVAFTHMIPRFERLVRQAAQAMGKQVEFSAIGAESEIDRQILDRIVSPLEHLMRNAVAHGIERPEQRRLAEKSATGHIILRLEREGNDVLLTLQDDGAGLNLPKIRQTAIQRGLITEQSQLKDKELMQLILEPGFSTAAEVTQIAGRGVGTDVVVSEVKQLGGTLEINSEAGRGASFQIRLPLTLAITHALLVNVGEEIYAVPHASVEGVVRIERSILQQFYDLAREQFSYAGQEYQVRPLVTLIGGGDANLEKSRKYYPMLLVRTGDTRMALQVDSIIGNRQIVVKSVGPQLSAVRWISGGTILADGRVAMILDVSALVRLTAVQHPLLGQVIGSFEDVSLPQKVARPTVMVVDDSITVRKVTSRLLQRHNILVVAAKDGVEALAILEENLPDLMLLDIEMPRMDGYELARHMQSSERMSRVPIIMITSRSGEKHRQRALELGVKDYLGKPYQEVELIESIHRLLAEKTG